MTEKTAVSSELTAHEDAGRIDPSRVGRLVLILLALILYSEVAPMQLSAVSAMLPKIAPDFPGAGAGITWGVTIVGVAGGATMVLIGKLGDLIGKKRVTLLSGVLFLIGALLCALTHSWALFLVGRALGGASWAMTALEYALVRDLMPRRWIPVAVGVVGTGFGIGAVVTPLLVGALTDHYSWRSVFWFMVIYMVVTTPLLMAAVPESPVRVRQRLDVIGAVLLGGGLATVLVYVSEGSSWGWATMSCLAYLIVGVVLLIAWTAWERRTAEPMMELSLLRAPKVAIPMVAAFLVTLTLTTVSVAIPYMFLTPKADQLKAGIIAGAAAKAHAPAALVAKAITFQGDVSYGNGFTIMQVALHITVWTAVFMMVFGVIGGFLCRKVGSRIPLIIAAVSLLAGSALWIQWHSTWQEQLFIGILYGLCSGFYYAANPNLIIDAVPAGRQGVSAAMLAVWGAVGTSVGTAVFTAIVSAHPFRMTAMTPTGQKVVTTIPQVYTNAGYSMVYLFLGVVPMALVLILALALRTGRTPARGGAPEETAEQEAVAAA